MIKARQIQGPFISVKFTSCVYLQLTGFSNIFILRNIFMQYNGIYESFGKMFALFCQKTNIPWKIFVENSW